MIRKRARLRFTKLGDLRFIGHRDLMRALGRLFRRGGLELSKSEGFHPKPRFSVPSALAVGLGGAGEVVELELAKDMKADEILAAVQPHCPEGLAILAAEMLPQGTAKAREARGRAKCSTRCNWLTWNKKVAF